MNTTALENMISALKVTRSIATEMGGHFSEYIEPLVHIISSEPTNLMSLKLSSTVRQESTRLCSALIFCCPTNEAKVTLLKALMPHIAKQVQVKLEALDFRAIKWLLKETGRCIKNFKNFGGAFLDGPEVSALIGLCLKACETVN